MTSPAAERHHDDDNINDAHGTTTARGDCQHDDAPASFEEYVCERLSRLGLDGDTYAPYVLPLFESDQQREQDADLLEEEWDTVLTLLRESAEAEDDDDDDAVDISGEDDLWTGFRRGVEDAWRVQKLRKEEAERQEKERNQERVRAEIERERQIALEEAASGAARTQEQHNRAAVSESEERAKRALVERFAYENEDDGEDDGVNDGANDLDVVSNRQAAALAAKEKEQQLRNKGSTTTKKDERQKTAQTRKEKEEKKDERRKRATKGERRR